MLAFSSLHTGVWSESEGIGIGDGRDASAGRGTRGGVWTGEDR